MLSATFAAFQDELIKIGTKVMSPEDAEKFFGSHAQRVANVEAMADKMHAERLGNAPTRIHEPGTGVVKPQAPVTRDIPQAVRKGTTAGGGHVPHPTALPHPAVPGGMGRAVGGAMRRGASMMRAHATPLGIGAAAGLGVGALALHHGAQNAASR